jgi:putative ABC transport system permease protein
MKNPEIEYPPSRLGLWILSNAVHGEIRESALTAFEEEFFDIAARKGSGPARLWFWGQVVKSLPFFLFDRIWWAIIMTRAYLLVTWRDLKKNKIFTAINILGLSTGLACGILVLLFVQNELSFDRYHENADHIYRIVRKRIAAAGEEYSTITPWIMKDIILNNYPEVRRACRLEFYSGFILEYGDKRLYSDILYADPSLLDIFTFPLTMGDKAIVLKEPDYVVLSEDMAQKIFGKEDPIGKTILTYYEDKKYPFQVSGILKNVPKNSHFRIDVLIPIEHLVRRYAKEPNRLNGCATYLLLDPRADPKAMEQKASDLIKRFSGSQRQAVSYYLQPLTSIYLHSEKMISWGAQSRAVVSYALSAIAFIILLIVCFNFMNLSTARASQRFREIGQRRVLGATRPQLIAQFLGESLFLSFTSLFIALALARVLLPVFNSMISRDVPLETAGHPSFLVGILLLTATIGVLSGIYPALFLSSFKPVDILKGQFGKGARFEIGLRKSLIVLQYALSMTFIIATVIVIRQTRFLQTTDLGFRKDNVLWISIMRDPNLPKSPQAIKDSLSRHPNIEKAIVTFFAPGGDSGVSVPCQPEGFSEKNPVYLNHIWVGEDFFSFFDIDILQGRDFSSKIAGDSRSAVILNESAVRYLGWNNPVGKQLRCEWIENGYRRPGPYTVIGVVKDYHDGPLQAKIQPTFYMYDPNRLFSIYLRIRPNNIPETLAFIEKTLKELNAVQPFEYLFLDDFLSKNLYRSSQSIRRVLTFASILSLVLSVLGVFGLVSYSTDRRKKETGIRRVLGASTSNIIYMFSREFIILALLGSIIAAPAALWIGHYYLRDYAYRTSIAWWPFLVAPVGVLLISLITVSIQSAKAAAMNPSDTLRHE